MSMEYDGPELIVMYYEPQSTTRGWYYTTINQW